MFFREAYMYLHVLYRVFLLFFPLTCQLLQDLLVDAGILYGKASVFRDDKQIDAVLLYNQK